MSWIDNSSVSNLEINIKLFRFLLFRNFLFGQNSHYVRIGRDFLCKKIEICFEHLGRQANPIPGTKEMPFVIQAQHGLTNYKDKLMRYIDPMKR